MHLNLSQQMKMSQQMKLAPRMIQSMEILQMPYLDLQERIDQELAENEFLENGADSMQPDIDESRGGFRRTAPGRRRTARTGRRR